MQDTLTRLQTKNNRNFLLLGNEIKSTQKSVAKMKEVVGIHLKTLENDILNIKGTLSTLRNLYTHVKSLRAAFYAYEVSLFSSISSLAANYVTLVLVSWSTRFLCPKTCQWRKPTWNKLSPAIRVGQEATYYEIQMILEVPSWVLAFPLYLVFQWNASLRLLTFITALICINLTMISLLLFYTSLLSFVLVFVQEHTVCRFESVDLATMFQ